MRTGSKTLIVHYIIKQQNCYSEYLVNVRSSNFNIAAAAAQKSDSVIAALHACCYELDPKHSVCPTSSTFYLSQMQLAYRVWDCSTESNKCYSSLLVPQNETVLSSTWLCLPPSVPFLVPWHSNVYNIQWLASKRTCEIRGIASKQSLIEASP